MNEITDKPIVVQTFKTKHLVICGLCKGEGFSQNSQGDIEACTTCKGTGKLWRCTEGVVKIFNE